MMISTKFTTAAMLLVLLLVLVQTATATTTTTTTTTTSTKHAEPPLPVLPDDYTMTYRMSTNHDLPPYSNATGVLYVSATQRFTRQVDAFALLQSDTISDFNAGEVYAQQCVTLDEPMCFCNEDATRPVWPRLDFSLATYEGRNELPIEGTPVDVYFFGVASPFTSYTEIWWDPATQAIRVMFQHSMGGQVALAVESFVPGAIAPAVFDVKNITADWHCVSDGNKTERAVERAIQHKQLPAAFSTDKLQLSVTAATAHVSDVLPSENPLFVTMRTHLFLANAVQGPNGIMCSICKKVLGWGAGKLCGWGFGALCAATALGAPVCFLIRSLAVRSLSLLLLLLLLLWLLLSVLVILCSPLCHRTPRILHHRSARELRRFATILRVTAAFAARRACVESNSTVVCCCFYVFLLSVSLSRN
jgi:hypothetical protein